MTLFLLTDFWLAYQYPRKSDIVLGQCRVIPRRGFPNVCKIIDYSNTKKKSGIMQCALSMSLETDSFPVDFILKLT